MNGKSDSGDARPTQFPDDSGEDTEFDLTQGIDYDLDDPYDVSADFSAQFAAATAETEQGENRTENPPEPAVDNQAQYEAADPMLQAPDDSNLTEASEPSTESSFELNGQEFSEAFNQTLSTTTVALRQLEQSRIDNPSTEDLEDADLAVKWLRKNRLDAELTGRTHTEQNTSDSQSRPRHSSNPEAGSKPSEKSGSRAFSVVATISAIALLMYFLVTRPEYLDKIIVLLQHYITALR